MTGRWYRSALRIACLSSVLLACGLGLLAAPDVTKLPKPTGYVSDLANVMSADDRSKLEDYCTRVEQQLGVQLAVVTINTLGDTPIDDFSLALARAWGIGAKKDNSGVLLLVVVKDHKDKVEVGRGVEQYVPDGFAGATLRSMRPDLRSANYGAACLEGVREIAAEIAKGKNISFNENPGLAPRSVPDREVPQGSSGLPIGTIIIGVVVLLFILNLFRRGGGGGYGGGGGGGFWTGLLLSSLMNSGRGGRGGSGWGGGGFGGGGGGGGGFGGFGGGDFGGGGASSDW